MTLKGHTAILLLYLPVLGSVNAHVLVDGTSRHPVSQVRKMGSSWTLPIPPWSTQWLRTMASSFLASPASPLSALFIASFDCPSQSGHSGVEIRQGLPLLWALPWLTLDPLPGGHFDPLLFVVLAPAS